MSRNDGRPSRRDLLLRSFNGIGAMALADLFLAQSNAASPLAPKAPHFPAKVKNCIFIYLSGGMSQVDTFDAKPALQKFAGQRMPAMEGVSGEIASFLKQPNQVMPNPYPYQRVGKSGRQISSLFKHLGDCVDDMAFVHGIKVDSNNHSPATMHVNTGSVFQGNPSVGAWVVSGLGSENQNLPGYVVLHDPRGGPVNGSAVWQSGYLPATYQGTPLRPSGTPILDLSLPAGVEEGPGISIRESARLVRSVPHFTEYQ
ncbi:MAG: DUF1501 domain-containing protein [Bryobacteraceae bacterium]